MQISKTKYILSLIGAFMVGVVLMGSAAAFVIGGAGSLIDDQKLSKIDKIIQSYYLQDYDKKKLIEGAYEGYVSALGDPYSAYMDKTAYESWCASSLGEYSGVGITFSEDDKGNFVVLSVTKNSPAEKAGFESGDILLTVDGQTYEDIDIMAADIRGKEGTKVTLEYVRDGKTKKATMTRAKIVQESVEYEMLDDETAHITIDQFIENTSSDFHNALTEVQKKGAKKLILDLRDNGGGLVDESVNIADEFLDEGVVCYVEDKNGKSDTYDAKDGKTDIKTVVLVNENSASASEILAGALKDNGFEIIGTKTFGKGIIQSTMELQDGSALKLTIMQYLSPDKHEIHKIGIEPTVKVKDNDKTDADEQLEKAEELLK